MTAGLNKTLLSLFLSLFLSLSLSFCLSVLKGFLINDVDAKFQVITDILIKSSTFETVVTFYQPAGRRIPDVVGLRTLHMLLRGIFRVSNSFSRCNKGNAVLVHATKAYRRSGGTSPFILSLGRRWNSVKKNILTSCRFTP